MENKLINAYENLAQSSEQLIKLQKERIVELETELATNKETIQRLFTLLDEAISIAKKPNTQITLN